MVRKKLINVGGHNSRDEPGPGVAMLLGIDLLTTFKPRPKSGNLMFEVAESGGLEPGYLLHNKELLHCLFGIQTHAAAVTGLLLDLISS